MKFFSKKHTKLCLSMLIMVQVSSCSWITSRRSIFGGEDEQADSKDKVSQADRPIEMVPKEQYDNLLQKYETALQSKRENEHIQTPSSLKQQSASTLVSELHKASDSPELAETVNVFEQSSRDDAIGAATFEVSDEKINTQIEMLRSAQISLNSNRFDDALSKSKELAQSPVKQIKVEAKYIIGEILFRQQEYDLSMQIFEEIIKQEAFSSIVIKVLGRLVVCSEKLKLNTKRDQYYSLLHDFFES